VSNRSNRTITIHAEVDTLAGFDSDTSLESDLEELPDISNISVDANPCVNKDTTDLPNHSGPVNGDHEVQQCFMGLAKPDITPILLTLKLKITETPKSPGGSRNTAKRLRTRSECSPLHKSGPYDVPPSILIKKNKRSQARCNIRDNRADETLLSRRRTASETNSNSNSNSK
jgi:hypothetical protein